jgi:hypothetical protein
MIVQSRAVKESIDTLDKKHIFVMIMALKQLCVHPMMLLNSTYKEIKDEEGKIQDSESSDEFGQP